MLTDSGVCGELSGSKGKAATGDITDSACADAAAVARAAVKAGGCAGSAAARHG